MLIMSELTDVEQRILTKIDKFEDKMDGTCRTIADMDTQIKLIKNVLDTHLEQRKKEVSDELETNRKRFNRVTVILSIIIAIVGVVSAIK